PPPPPEETVLYVEHRYVCSECSHLSPSLEEALLHQQHHLPPSGAPPHHRYELLNLGGPPASVSGGGGGGGGGVAESNQYQCLECGQLLVTPGQLLEHQEMHIKLLAHDPDPPAVKPPAPHGGKPPPGVTAATAATAAIHYECVECKALFTSQELWLSHRQSHRAEVTAGQGQGQTLVTLEHSYRKPAGDAGDTVQLLLYECGECLQLFQTPKDFLEHQAAHLGAAGTAAGSEEAP
ncbi:ZN574 protein, partial [Podargus strigoides]|nr:ZN574 protein [Podargus strigoides]